MKTRRTATLSCAVLVLLIFAPPAAAQRVYKCVDAKGKVYYTQVPPRECLGRESEELSKKIRRHYRKRIVDTKNQRHSIHEDRLIDELRMKFGTKVNIINESGIGKIEIEFYTDEDLDRIVDTMLSSESTTIDDN